MITSLVGESASSLGLAAHPEQEPRCVPQARSRGVNFFFFYGPSPERFGEALAPLVRKRREELIVASGSGSRKRRTLLAARRKILDGLGIEMLDVFFAEYINPSDDPAAIFGAGGVLDELDRWKAEGVIRCVGATDHDRRLAQQLAADPRVDLLMHRFNMAHRKAGQEVFPEAIRSKTPVVAFTATRWGTLLEPAGPVRRRAPSIVTATASRTRRYNSSLLRRKRARSLMRIWRCSRCRLSPIANARIGSDSEISSMEEAPTRSTRNGNEAGGKRWR
jgi:aryl-alcohol dehydrogenase-like predicted oxidoreductase